MSENTTAKDGERRDLDDFRVLLRKRIEASGPAGQAWAAELPAIIAECATRWRLRVGHPFDGLTYNFAAPVARADGTAAVLKIGMPQDPELRSEAAALAMFGGDGTCSLLEIDMDLGALLLEHVQPGTSLETVDDDRATIIAAEVMKKLRFHAPGEYNFPTVGYWADGIRRLLRDRCEGGTGPLPPSLVEQAEELFAELLATSGAQFLLHGDLHHGNILAGARDLWLAIDPKGVIGEAEYEVGAWLRNPADLLQRPRPKRLLERRIHLLCDVLGYDKRRVRDWAVAQAVLSAVWVFDDHPGGWEFPLRCAELLMETRL